MRADFLDRFSRLDSPIHRLPAGVKVAGALAIIIATVLVPFRFHCFFISIAALLLITAALSRIPPRFLIRRLLLLEPFVLGIGILMLLEPNGLRIFLVFALRSTLCLFTMILLSNTTPFSKILAVLRALHTPALLLTILALMYRYLFVLIDQTQRMRRARLSRTFTPSRSRTWKHTGTLIGQLFVRTSERADRIYDAMCARGWK
jgi:cobalt/nickel transport system permease protein